MLKKVNFKEISYSDSLFVCMSKINISQIYFSGEKRYYLTLFSIFKSRIKGTNSIFDLNKMQAKAFEHIEFRLTHIKGLIWMFSLL